jgi:hypothetical protein
MMRMMWMMAQKVRAASPVGARRGGMDSDGLNDMNDIDSIHGGAITTASVQQKRSVRQ